MGHSQGKGAFSGVQSPGFRWVSVSGRHAGEAVGQGTQQPYPVCGVEAWPVHFHPCFRCSNCHLAQSSCHLPLPVVGDKEAWLAASTCCLPLLLPTLVPRPLSFLRMSLRLVCVTVRALSPPQGLLLSPC